ncbi:MAG: hypothetical protein EXX96DRAFT_551196 [Benjaminiella poitrasii]|nr:MAG: hypothetical protein EXX96DRAFT_551196 [Benjaminiella poitrasii]
MMSTLPIYNTKRKNKLLSSATKKLVACLTLFGIILYFYTNTSTYTMQSSSAPIEFDNYNINPLSWAPSLSDRIGKSAFPKSYFTSKALLENELSLVSAVILRVTDDDESIVYTVKHMLKYPFISDIYIYNLVKGRPLRWESLKLDQRSKETTPIEIIEPSATDEQLDSLARFTLCATASRLYCYFQDDTFKNPYMDSLYTNLLRFPSLIHANSKPSHYENEMKWRFHNSDIRLHTGYADFRYGAFVPRWKVQTFLTQLGKSSLTKENIRQAEHYFAIWVNQYPWLLSNPPLLANGDKATNLDIAYPATLDQYTYDAIRHLQNKLTLDQSEAPQDYFERSEEVPAVEYRDVRSSCTNDQCLFITNMDPFVAPNEVIFDYHNITSIIKLENRYDTLSTVPSSVEWDEHSYHRVVDNDPNTCWNTINAPKKNDYFGLILVGATKTSQITIHTTAALHQPELSVSVLESGGRWISCKTTTTASNSHRIQLDLHCPSSIKHFRAIKVNFVKDQTEFFEICGLSLDNLSV